MGTQWWTKMVRSEYEAYRHTLKKSVVFLIAVSAIATIVLFALFGPKHYRGEYSGFIISEDGSVDDASLVFDIRWKSGYNVTLGGSAVIDSNGYRGELDLGYAGGYMYDNNPVLRGETDGIEFSRYSHGIVGEAADSTNQSDKPDITLVLDSKCQFILISTEITAAKYVFVFRADKPDVDIGLMLRLSNYLLPKSIQDIDIFG